MGRQTESACSFLCWDGCAVLTPVSRVLDGASAEVLLPGGAPHSGEDVVHDRATVDDFDGTGTWGHEFLVGVDAELVVDRGGEVFDRHGVVFRFCAEGVGGTVDHALFEAATGEEDGEDFGPVVASAGSIDFGGAAEFGGDHDEGAVEETAFGEVVDEAGVGLVEVGDLASHGSLDIVVVVPSAVGDGDEADAGFDEAAGHEEAHAGFIAAVFVLQFVGFFFEGEGLAGLRA